MDSLVPRIRLAAFTGLLLAKPRVRLAAALVFGVLAAATSSAALALAPHQASSAIVAAHFPEPLVATAPTTPTEDAALSRAILAYERRKTADDFSSLVGFLSQYPESGWTASIQTNLGLLYLHYGYFSRAIEAWKTAFAQGKDAQTVEARALVDRAVGELARIYANLGYTAELAQLFTAIESRPIVGSATEAVQVAREQLSLVEKDPRHLFICGPLALQSLMLAEGSTPDRVTFLQWYRASPRGTSLAEVEQLANKAGLAHHLIFRKPGQALPRRGIVHWKVGHFAAIVGEANGRIHVKDSAFPESSIWVTPAALDAEASGYFLVPTDIPVDSRWRPVDSTEAASVWGKGPTNGTRPGDAGDPTVDGPPPAEPGDDGGSCPLCSYGIKESSVSLTLFDTPVGYTPPVGPSAKVLITYNQREDSQPQNFGFFNISAKWTLNWLGYITDDPTNPGANVSRTLGGGGAFYYTGYNSGTGNFAAQDTDGSILTLVTQTPITYQRQLSDGRIQVFAQSDGSTGFPRRVFLSRVIDPQGNATNLAYDGQLRLTSLTDVLGRQTTFSYGLPGRPLLVTQITDPFGRSAKLGYDAAGRLSAITDILGLTSSFGYDANSLVNSMTTPYGTTNFAFTAPGTSAPPRFVQVTDPLGLSEREEWLEPAPIPDSDNAATVPQGMPVAPANQYLSYRDSFYWDKNAYVVAGCTPTGGCDYTKARDRHFTHVPPNTNIKSTVVESVKYALENRTWFNYPGQTDSKYAGTYDRPIAVGRVLDDGTTQLTKLSYDPVTFNLTSVTDPKGRKTTLTYANHIDVAAVTQTTAGGVESLVAQFTYDTRHRPLAYTDAASQTTLYTYNAARQLTSVTDPLGQKTKYQYDSSANLTTIVNANNATAASFTYDDFARVRSYTDSEGWTVTYDYDAGDRITKVTYPDGSAQTYKYDKLDLVSYIDRQARSWTYAYDANRRLTGTTDPLGQVTSFAYSPTGKLTSLTDPKSNVTTWTYDVQNRLTEKKYQDNSTVTYTYETTTSRLKTETDALGQTKQYSYASDDLLVGIDYLNAVNATPNVDFAYDTYFPRLISMTDGTGTTQYSYAPIGSLGALQLQQQSGPLASSAIAWAYDELGRLKTQSVAGSGDETFDYDSIGRRVGHGSDLGSFALSYLGETSQITQRHLLPLTTSLATTWSYLNNVGDRRLSAIGNVGLTTSQFSNFQFTTTPENSITAITETSDTTNVTPSATTQSATYNNLNQLTVLSGQSLTYDANGNLLSDGQRNYSWDAGNRLVGITYSGQSGKATAFAYDGFGRRLTITSTPTGGGSPVVKSYLWCGEVICQARNAGNSPIRRYLAEGEFVPGSLGQPYYYASDQIGSARRVFASPTSAPAYAYDPWGNPLQATAPLADFGFAGMFASVESGLSLTLYRGYDPVVGRWISRDPLQEWSELKGQTVARPFRRATDTDASAFGNLDNPERARALALSNSSRDHLATYRLPDVAALVQTPADLSEYRVGSNLYGYVNNDPLNLIDPTGEKSLQTMLQVCGVVVGITIGGQAIGVRTPIIYQPPTTTIVRVADPNAKRK